MLAGANDVAEDIKIQTPSCVGIDVAGNVNYVNRVRISNATGAACGALRIGHTTSQGGTVDPHVSNTLIENDGSAGFGMRIEDCGGCFIGPGNDILFAIHNTQIDPGALPTATTALASALSTGSATVIVSSAAGISVGNGVAISGLPANTTVTAISGTTLTVSNVATANTAAGVSISFLSGQTVQFGFWSDTVMADTGTGLGVTIDTASPFALVQGNFFNGTWASNNVNGNILVTNTGGGTVDGNHFIGHRSYLGGGGSSVEIAANTHDTTFDGASICGYGSGTTGLYIDPTAGDIAVSNSRIGGNCATYTRTGAAGITMAGSNPGVRVQNNNLAGNTIPLNEGTNTPLSGSIISGNVPIPAPATLTVSASPYNFTAPSSGTVYITAGTVSGVALNHAGVVVAMPANQQSINVAVGDIVSVNYSAAPTVQFVGS